MTPSIPEIRAATSKIVRAARRKGELEQISKKTIRQTLETQFDLEEGFLSAQGYKQAVSSAVDDALEEDSGTEDIPEPAVQPQEPQKEKTPPRNTKKRKSEEALESKPKKKQAVAAPSKSKSKFKSAEMIASSDHEEDTSTELQKQPESGGSSSKENKTTQAKKPKAGSSVAKSKKTTPPAKAESDSELSVLEDEPPKKKTKSSKSADKGQAKPKGKKVELSKDEETIKRLKSLVLGCGVRKVWGKVFKDVDSPSEQIRMLKKILTDLGMSGRMSMEQARAIKEKRELAQELEDVQAFAAATTRSKGSKDDEDDEDDESEEEEEALPAKRKTARTSIMAFLGDQSDSD
ncbi:hypothetical protein FB45DRAFT_897330 [Roridomyces roridus]|uniref:DEK-C domain-containing protein n=1 Tax=Roridomyces roridus TaxID=1738132 RepID=A0AAD7CDE8_9AGAR|nr:hypothetical protein FB45DRAFT_897330 [Roridomyces roridus]